MLLNEEVIVISINFKMFSQILKIIGIVKAKEVTNINSLNDPTIKSSYNGKMETIASKTYLSPIT